VLREPIILASPEIRTTIVQTWHSTKSDPLPTDIFALGAVIADILTFLCKRGSGSFSRFRSAKNRTAGRGGGLADASFHANIGQVLAWLDLLVRDAKKKAPKAEGRVFRAIEPMVEVLKACLEREPEDRIKSADLEKRLGECVWQSAKIGKLHCYKALQALAPPKAPVTMVHRPRTEPGSRHAAQGRDESEPVHPNEPSLKHVGPRSMSGESGTRIPTVGPESSTSSLSSFNFEYDFHPGRSEESGSKKMRHHAKGTGLDMERALGMRESQKHSRGHSWDNWHNNDSNIDPSLTLSQSNPGKTHINAMYDSSSSDDIHEKSFLLLESRPGSMVRDPIPAPVHHERSNPPIEYNESYERLRAKSKLAHIPPKETFTVARDNMNSNSTVHQPNSSRMRMTRSGEPLFKADGIEQSFKYSGVQKVLNTSNFSRPRFPSQDQVQKPGKFYLKN
jgi:hypothetical protein